MSLLTLSVASWADSVTINNHSFEDDVHADGAFTIGLITGWSFVNTAGQEVGTWNPSHIQTGCELPDQFLDEIPDGDQIAYSKGEPISQQTGVTITEGHRYTLNVGVGGRCNSGGKESAVLLGGNTQVGAQTNQTNVKGDWDEVTVVYDSLEADPNAGELLTVMLDNVSNLPQVQFDDVRLSDVEVLTCSGFYAPFDAHMTVKKKVKRALPLKFNLYDVFGTEIIDTDLANPPVVQVTMGGNTGSGIDDYDGDLLPNGLSDDGNEFRYDPDSMQWILNLGLKAYTASGDYTISVVAGDSSYVVEVCSETFTRQ